MLLDLERSIIYDTIRYFDVFFNYENFKDTLLQHDLDIALGFKYFNLINEGVEIDPDLGAFFIIGEKRISMFTNWFMNRIKSISSITDLVTKTKDKASFQKEFLDIYSAVSIEGEEEKEEIQPITRKSVYKLNLDANVKISIVAILTDYESVMQKLSDSIYMIYEKIKALHTAHIRKIKGFKLEEKYVNIFEELYKEKIEDDNLYCVSLLHPYGYRVSIYDKYVWIFGHLCKKYLDRTYDFLNVDYKSVASILSNELNIEILNIIKEHGTINPAGILRILDDKYECSPATIYRLISGLISEKVINVAEKTKKNVYYSLNKDYFRHASVEMNRKLLYYIDK